MRLDQAAADVEAEPAPRDRRFRDAAPALEPLEDPRPVVGRDPGPVVGHGHDHARRALRPGRDPDPRPSPAYFCALERRFASTCRIRRPSMSTAGRPRRHLDRDGRRAGEFRPSPRRTPRCRSARSVIDPVENQLVAVEPADVDDLVDEDARPPDGVPDPLEVPLPLVGVEAEVEQALGVAADQRQRRAQLVADRGDERALELVELPPGPKIAKDAHHADHPSPRPIGAYEAATRDLDSPARVRIVCSRTTVRPWVRTSSNGQRVAAGTLRSGGAAGARARRPRPPPGPARRGGGSRGTPRTSPRRRGAGRSRRAATPRG